MEVQALLGTKSSKHKDGRGKKRKDIAGRIGIPAGLISQPHRVRLPAPLPEPLTAGKGLHLLKVRPQCASACK